MRAKHRRQTTPEVEPIVNEGGIEDTGQDALEGNAEADGYGNVSDADGNDSATKNDAEAAYDVDGEEVDMALELAW